MHIAAGTAPCQGPFPASRHSPLPHLPPASGRGPLQELLLQAAAVLHRSCFMQAGACTRPWLHTLATGGRPGTNHISLAPAAPRHKTTPSNPKLNRTPHFALSWWPELLSHPANGCSATERGWCQQYHELLECVGSAAIGAARQGRLLAKQHAQPNHRQMPTHQQSSTGVDCRCR